MICIAAALTMLHLQNLVFGLSHSDNPGQSPCHPRDSCAPSRNEYEDHLWGNYTCECGPHCVRYGTCCADSPHAGASPRAERRGEKCERLSPYFSEYSILVSSCSDRWRHGQHVRDMCEGRDTSVEDPLSAAPVTNAAMGVTYKNGFCATCNFDGRDLHAWDVALFHEPWGDSDASNVTGSYMVENLIYDRERNSWGVSTDAHPFLEMRLIFSVPYVLWKVVKKCHPVIVSDCDASHDSGLRDRCLSYYSPVIVKADGKRAFRKYRNVHCAICNGALNAEDLACAVDVQRRKKPSFSFSFLIDVNRDVNHDVDGRWERCGAREMWDPFAKKCRTLVCALPGYVVKDGKCVQS